MKVSDILLNYLLKHKKLALPALGTFTLNGGYTLSEDEKRVILPPGTVEFTLDPNTPEDPELIAAIAADTGKFKPLASADLESLVIQGKQLMNISKPFIIEGIGTLQKNHRNEIEYIPFVDETQRLETDKRLEEPGEAIRFDDNYLRPKSRKDSRPRNITLALLMLVAIGILGWVGFYFYKQSGKEDSNIVTLSEPQLIPTDTASAQNYNNASVSAADSVQQRSTTDSTSAPATARTDSFHVVLEIAAKERALKRYADLREWGHKVSMTTKDSTSFKIFYPVKAPLSDSARYRDSLTRFYGKKVWIELQ